MSTNNAIDAPIPFSLANGGTGANLTASNGGILYSGASAAAILAGTATANQALLSGASTTPAWSTATYPATTTINQLLYSSSANVIAGVTVVNSAVLTTTSGGVPTWSTSFPSGFPPFATVDQTSASVTMAVNTQYIVDDGASLVTLTLPSTCAIGSIFRIIGFAAGGWKIAQAASQQIRLGSSTTTSGTGGSLASTNTGDSIEIVCTTANTAFTVLSVIGNITVV